MLYIIIPVFKRIKHTEAFIASCDKYIKEKKQYIIVDDDKPDFEHEDKYSSRLDCTVLKGTGDLWWGGSVNLGLDHLRSETSPLEDDIVVVANNDVLINKDTYSKLMIQLDNNSDAFYHPRVFNLNNEEIPSCRRLLTWMPYRVERFIAPINELTEVDLATGRFLLSYWNNFNKVGNVSKNLPQYHGDFDFSLKAKKIDIKTYLVKSAHCYVDTRTTGSKEVYLKHFMSLNDFYQAYFLDKRSVLNLKYKWHFYRNHNTLFLSILYISKATVIAVFTLINSYLKPFYNPRPASK